MAAGKRVGDRRIRAYVPSRYEIWYGAQPQTLERSRILSLLPATAEDLLRAKDAVPTQGDIGTPGFPPHPVTSYHSVLTTEEARAVTQALDDAGLGRAGTASRSQARASIQLLPRRGQSETSSSSCSCPTFRTASRSAWRADQRLRIDRFQAHEPARRGIHFRNESRGFDNEHREEYVGTAS